VLVFAPGALSISLGNPARFGRMPRARMARYIPRMNNERIPAPKLRNPAHSMPQEAARAVCQEARQGEAAGVGMTGKGLAAAAVGCLLAGAAVFELIAPEPPSKTNLNGVTIQAEPSTLSISSKAAFVQCFLTLNSKFTGSANLAAGKTLVPWSRFFTKHDVRFDPAVEVPNTLMIECLNPVPRAGFFRFTR
jgi:hypothetical protein